MNLFLSRHSPFNSVYTNESGQVLYKVDTPHRPKTPTSTIYKIIANDPEPLLYDKYESEGDNDESEEDAKAPELSDSILKDKFNVLATIEHKLFGDPVMNFDGKSIGSKEYFKKDGFGIHGHHRVFTGPDGREYKWLFKTTTCHLCLDDAAQTLVAKFHPNSLGIIGKKHPAYLEVFPDGLQILDTIMVTFITIEKKRKNRERAAITAASAHGGGSPQYTARSSRCVQFHEIVKIGLVILEKNP